MANIFFEERGLKITDTVLVTPSGDQYPIRNISSVKSQTVQKMWCLVVGVLLVIVGVVSMFQADKGAAGAILIGPMFIAFWWFTKKVILEIGTGGLPQAVLTVQPASAKNLKFLNEAMSAINESISNLQKT